jgi:N-acetylneuraminic acid mutarotase
MVKVSIYSSDIFYKTKQISASSRSAYPNVREQASTAVDSEGTFWMFFGCQQVGSTYNYSNEVWKFTNYNWSQSVKDPHPSARCGSQMWALNDTIYIFGGKNETG